MITWQSLSAKNALFLGILFGVIAVYGLASTIATHRTQAAQVLLQEEITRLESEAVKVAAAINKNETMYGVDQLLSNCSVEDRSDFETLLSRLESGLSKAELSNLSQFFDRCAAVSAQKRTILTIYLENIVKSLSVAIEARKSLSKYEEMDTRLMRYQELLQAEKVINTQLFTLVDLQAEIITSLQTGVGVVSKEADLLRSKGGTIQSEIAAKTEIANLLRKELQLQ